MSIKAATLFSGIGVDEYFLQELGVDVVVANELVKSRALAHSLIYPGVEVVNASITEEETRNILTQRCKTKKVNLIIATPPCQGLSTVGSNKTPKALYGDKRNFLVLDALDVFERVQPDYFLIENVPRFQDMRFTEDGRSVSLIEMLEEKYSDQYEVTCDILNAADYGVPQTRMRILYRLWRKGLSWPLPEKEPIQTVLQAIGDLPSLEAGQDSGIKNHYARRHPDNQVLCMRHTPTGMSATKNIIFYPQKPDGTRIKAYGNSYKRMKWDVPAPTITMRNEIISSQENVHPGRQIDDDLWSDARVLTLRELLVVSSLPPDMNIPTNLTETAFRQVIGEGIPPLLMKKVIGGISNAR